ncbi:MAG: helix-hairpin-helix domain-containing protein [Thermomicrobiales bacterium]
MANHPANARVVHEPRRLATLMEIAGENPFRIRAIKAGADAIDELEHPVAVIAADPEMLKTVPGIGSGIASLIQEILKPGQHQLSMNCLTALGRADRRRFDSRHRRQNRGEAA